jgi:hypothetical protein
MSDASETGQPSAPTMFNVDTSVEQTATRELRRMSIRRIAVWGLLTGGVMALIFALCVLLLFLASQGGS